MTNTAIARRLRHFLLLRLACYTSHHHPINILEARLLPPKRSTTATALITLVSHRIMLGRQVRFLQPLSTSAQPQRPISPTTSIAPVSPHHALRFSHRLVRLFLAPRYAAACTALHPDVFAQMHGCRIVSNLSSRNPVPHAVTCPVWHQG
jgi:hypothetical protein